MATFDRSGTIMHPYQSLPNNRFWRPAISSLNFLDLSDVYTKKFDISPSHRVVTAGSCFAQHISRQLKTASFNFVDYEPAPWILPEKTRANFGYGIYSARYGNIYTTRQLLQTFERAFGEFTPCEQVWESNGRFYDPFRPTIEKGGFCSLAEFEAARRTHYRAVRDVFEKSDLLIFTLGLTEAWRCKADGAVLPLCPETVPGGVFDASRYEFHNFDYDEIRDDLNGLIRKARARNPRLRLLLTVSPVPLTATASHNHVLVATTYSKSVLRSVAGCLAQTYDFVDYFPAYELVATHPSRAMLYEPDLREVNKTGVDLVMRHFFAQHTADGASRPNSERNHPLPKHGREDEIICEELLLDRAR